MRLLCAFFLFVAGYGVGLAQDPIVRLTLENDPDFEVVEKPTLVVYPLSDRVKRIMSESAQRQLVAADYASDTMIRTESPRLALQ
ncbi:hypothetical protein [Synoicihabitans lomoniglobus]|uniref:Uncharacterized protein n=1 Tax=Synoicihabitans lomoniglobus TaxID=2909285 RepID=A0AAF0CQI2_9BACT|nr:hypothetical protein [Opitutaceae bacterium LMO-M01]WED66220.1 hypothetical protein PXH66_05090 [Opitutaceae bacterium LMO-M01]